MASASHPASPIPSSSVSVEVSAVIPPASSHLSYPTFTASPAASPPRSDQPRPILQERLYVGNLHPTVDEYTLLQVFTKFGKVSKLDFLFHKSGPMRGKPRGYAFVEFSDPDVSWFHPPAPAVAHPGFLCMTPTTMRPPNIAPSSDPGMDAKRALVTVNDKLLRGRKLVVTHAHQAPLDSGSAYGSGARYKRSVTEAGKPTTLSMLKSASAGRSDATEAKIAKMEAKLRQMEQSSSGIPATRLHPSLPAKPPPTTLLPSHERPSSSSASRQPRKNQPLPSLPLQQNTKSISSSALSPPITPTPHSGATKKSIAGVRIVKKKDR
ncbi:uncharacterized protein FIBRA_03100 [Fibroporia radiculosa]|uniref:RRM domain-containing protein n=1 Tax=Fibroporia radiculosa TaxID=599839 RepID=J4HVT1_9APHY|nr:uncharacterized protein FIBRA_03100 [Fibroporia radiculosa]CCM01052.1 predicted protein [Fibroporia radiculosa]